MGLFIACFFVIFGWEIMIIINKFRLKIEGYKVYGKYVWGEAWEIEFKDLCYVIRLLKLCLNLMVMV